MDNLCNKFYSFLAIIIFFLRFLPFSDLLMLYQLIWKVLVDRPD